MREPVVRRDDFQSVTISLQPAAWLCAATCRRTARRATRRVPPGTCSAWEIDAKADRRERVDVDDLGTGGAITDHGYEPNCPFAYAAGAEIIDVHTFAAIGFRIDPPAEQFHVVLDALRGELFASKWQRDPGGRPARRFAR